MDKYDPELIRAMNLPKEIMSTWAQVFLKSGQTMFVKATAYSVFEETIQNGIEETAETLAMPEIRAKLVTFYDEDDEPTEEEIFLPWENVSAIRFFKPITDGADRI